MKAAALLLAALAASALGACHNRCSGHGECQTDGTCACYFHWTGPDCSERSCPNGPAWFDVVNSTDDGHHDAECSNMGDCDRATGNCDCRDGFGGQACQRQTCGDVSDPCSGHGMCVSMRSAANLKDGRTLVRNVSYGLWDADMTHGCLCDYGYEGHDCSLRQCPKGDDPRTAGQQDEYIELVCLCDAACSGDFNLYYQGRRSAQIAHDADAATVEAAVEALRGIDDVSVTFSAGAQVCDTAEVTTTITFHKIDYRAAELGYLTLEPTISTSGTTQYLLMQTRQDITCTTAGSGTAYIEFGGLRTADLAETADASTVEAALEALENIDEVAVTQAASQLCDADGETTSITWRSYEANVEAVSVTHSFSGATTVSVATPHRTKELSECSNLGYCDHSTGTCACASGYDSDNGVSSSTAGDVGNCGFYQVFQSPWPGQVSCPGILEDDGVTVRNGTEVQYIYWVDSTNIVRSLPDGTEATNLIAHTSGTALALDLNANKMYWVEAGGSQRIRRADTDGSNDEDIVTGLTTPVDLVLDIDADIMYFTDSGTGKIQSVDMDGGAVTDVLTGLTDVQGIALDQNEDLLYYVDDTSVLTVDTGGATTTTIMENLVDPVGVALDLMHGEVWVLDQGNTTILFSELDGSWMRWPIYGLTSPRFFDIDAVNQKLWYTDDSDSKIVSVKRNGDESVNYALHRNLNAPVGIALDIGLGPGDGELECSGHGSCNTGTYECACQTGWLGAGCGERECPKGRAWFDEPSSPDVAHAWTECSNKGVCDRLSGLCSCADGFEGDACERLACRESPGDPVCSGHGRCVSMAQMAELATDNGDAAAWTYGAAPWGEQTWDAHNIYGCLCDSHDYVGVALSNPTDWTGLLCEKRACPTGDDPSTDGVAEEQTIACDATGGTVTLVFRQQTTDAISATATAAAVEAALEALTSVGDVSVAFDSGVALCAAGGINAAVTFNTEHGDLPDMTVGTNALSGGASTASVSETVTGTKETAECSNHGHCDYSTGLCECFPGYYSSDGMGNRGTRGDCSFRA